METLATFLEGLAVRYSDRPALLYKPGDTVEVWSYARLWEQTNRVAAWLQARGVGKGDRVVLWAPNSPGWVAAYFGSLRLGAVVVPVDVRSSPDFVARAVGQTDPKVALLSKTTRGQWQYPAPTALMDEMETLAAGSPAQDGTPIVPDDIAELMFTSGTTGNPNGVILSHGNIMSNVAAIDQSAFETPHNGWQLRCKLAVCEEVRSLSPAAWFR